MEIRIAGIINESVVDGPGIRMVIFTQGCPHRCPGCHNPETHDPNGGEAGDTGEIADRIRASRFISGITISGGEPFFQPEPCALLAEAAHSCGKTVMLYSGYTFEQLQTMAKDDAAVNRLLLAGDMLVDGPYLEEKRNIDLPFRGSENQRIIDLPQSLALGKAVVVPMGREAYNEGGKLTI